MFQRKIYQKLLDWKEDSKGKTALLIEGARRIGKSTIARMFGEQEYKSYILVDFAFAPRNIQSLFEDMNDLDYFFLQLQLQYNVDLHERNSLIIFDEVQFNPLARQAIKKLVEDGRYDYIETGSLISIKKNIESILIPSEERKIEMFPMDFEEFLWAIGDTTTNQLLKKAFEQNISLGDQQNRNILQKFRLYMLIGGMPQAVTSYIETNNFRIVDEVKRDIIKLYEEDFYKIDPTGKISTLFDAIPAELNRNSSRYQVSSVVENDLYQKLLSNKLQKNLGMLYENMIAQTLAANSHKLFYYSNYDAEQKRNFEVDFLLNKGNKICPIEVKSGNYRKHRSLDEFSEKFSERIGTQYLIHTKDARKENNLRYLPMYMAQFL